MPTPSSSELQLPIPPSLPVSDVREAAAVAQPAPTNAGNDENDEPPLSLTEQLKSPAAFGYYISAVVHIVAYGTMALAFAYFASTWSDEPDVPPIRASLDDFDRADALPRFEEVGKIDMGSPSSQTSIQKLNTLIQQSDDAKIQSALQDMLPSLDAVNATGVGGEANDDSFKFRVPTSGFAVTKGSFTAWTVPEVPEPGQTYRIVIQVKLPDKVETYRLSDLIGKVTGTDGYVQGIPYDRDKRFAVSYTDADKKEVIIESRTERIDVRNNKIQLVVIVPGARRMVKDTIKIKSKRLREDHEITLVFGGRGRRQPDSDL
ncbi:MAG: hypothetical protein ABJZ55_07975 [Fuerstiella sp.]